MGILPFPTATSARRPGQVHNSLADKDRLVLRTTCSADGVDESEKTSRLEGHSMPSPVSLNEP